MPNVIESLLLPTSTAYRTQAAAETRKIQGYGEAMQSLRDFYDHEERTGIADAIDVLARRGQLNNNSIAKVVAALGQRKLSKLGDAQMQADSARIAARQQVALLGDYAKQATVADVANLGMKVGSMALGTYATSAPLNVAGQAAVKGGLSGTAKMNLAGLVSGLGGDKGYLNLAAQQAGQPAEDARLKAQKDWEDEIMRAIYPDLFKPTAATPAQPKSQPFSPAMPYGTNYYLH